MKRPLKIASGKAAALFIDLQEEHRQDRRFLVEDFQAVIANARKLQTAARRSEIPVFHCAYIVDVEQASTRPFHPVLLDGTSAFSDKDSPWTAVCSEVAPAGDEPLLIKSEASAFGSGELAGMLRSCGAEWLFVSGVWTEACVDATVKDAMRLGFRVVLVKDACGSGSKAMHQTAVLNLANRLYGGAVVDTSDACTVMHGIQVKAWMVEGAVPLRFSFENVSELYDAL